MKGNFGADDESDELVDGCPTNAICCFEITLFYLGIIGLTSAFEFVACNTMVIIAGVRERMHFQFRHYPATMKTSSPSKGWNVLDSNIKFNHLYPFVLWYRNLTMAGYLLSSR